MRFRPMFFGLTFKPRFHNSSSYPRNVTDKQDEGLYSTSLTDFKICDKEPFF